MADSIISPSDGVHQKRKNIQELCPLTIQQWLKLWMKLPIHPTMTTRNLFQFLSPMQVLNVSTILTIFLHYLNCDFTKYNLLIHHNPNVKIFNYTL